MKPIKRFFITKRLFYSQSHLDGIRFGAPYRAGFHSMKTKNAFGEPSLRQFTLLASYFYFKAGCYYPTNGSGVPAAGTAKVTFSSLTATHQP